MLWRSGRPHPHGADAHRGIYSRPKTSAIRHYAGAFLSPWITGPITGEMFTKITHISSMSERFVGDGRLRLSGRNDASLSRLCHGQTASCQPASSLPSAREGIPSSSTFSEGVTTTDRTSRTSYGEPQASVEDRKGSLVSVRPNRLVTPLLSSAMVLVSIAISYPHPCHTRRSARRQSGQHDGRDPNFPAHSPQTSPPPDPVSAFAQVTGLPPQNLMTAKTGPFSIPPPGI